MFDKVLKKFPSNILAKTFKENDSPLDVWTRLFNTEVA